MRSSKVSIASTSENEKTGYIMAGTELRSIFKNDTVMARRMDGDDDHSSDTSHSPRSSMLSTDSETLVSPLSKTSLRSQPSGGAFNTGPKGVREDARAWNESQARFDNEKRMAQQAQFQSVGQATSWSQDQADMDARERWVEKRMKELSKKRHGPHASATGAGKLEAVDAAGYLETVESNPFVVVLIYDDEEEDGREIVDLLSTFPVRYPHYKFILLHRTEAELDVAAVPAVLYYHNTHLERSVMRIQDEIPSTEELDRKGLEAVLVREGILSGSGGAS